MKRFTDPVLFGALFVLDTLAWLILMSTGGIETADPGYVAPITVGSIIVIACPALLVATVLGFARAITRQSPRSFYMWALCMTVAAAVIVGIASAATSAWGIEVGFGWMTWFFAIMALALLIALIIALTGGIPSEKHLGTSAKESNADTSASRNDKTASAKTRTTAPLKSRSSLESDPPQDIAPVGASATEGSKMTSKQARQGADPLDLPDSSITPSASNGTSTNAPKESR